MEEDKRVYSPDIPTYSFEGQSYFLGTILSFLVAPIRIVTRVMHNIIILPADLKEDYAKSLMVTSTVLLILGIFDWVVAGKWMLCVSQVIPLIYAVKLKSSAHQSVELAREKREIEIDMDEVTNICESVYDELNVILGGKEE